MINRSVSSKALRAALALAVMWAGSAQAEWKFKGELGVVIASGNTETETISGKFDAVNEVEKWKHSLGASALRSRDQDGLTGDRYEVHAQSDYKLSDRSYVTGSVRYDNDKFSPYSYQAVGAVGYGYKFFDTETTKLSVELGAGYRRTEDRLTNATNGDGIVRGAMNYAQQLTASTSVFDKFLVEAGSDNTYLQNELGVMVKMTDQLALSVAHLIRHNTDINENAVPTPKKTDQLITVNLVFSF